MYMVEMRGIPSKQKEIRSRISASGLTRESLSSRVGQLLYTNGERRVWICSVDKTLAMSWSIEKRLFFLPNRTIEKWKM